MNPGIFIDAFSIRVVQGQLGLHLTEEKARKGRLSDRLELELELGGDLRPPLRT